MLIPSKHMHPDKTVLRISLVLLDRVRRVRVGKFEELRRIAGQSTEGGDVLFVPAMNLLFLLGLIEYRQAADSFEYVGPNETL